jgi:hypothetical protein
MQQLVFVTKVRDEVFANSHAAALKATVIYGINCLACQEKFFVNNPLDV